MNEEAQKGLVSITEVSNKLTSSLRNPSTMRIFGATSNAGTSGAEFDEE